MKIAGKHFPSQCTTPSGISILLFQTPKTDKTVRNKYNKDYVIAIIRNLNSKK